MADNGSSLSRRCDSVTPERPVLDLHLVVPDAQPSLPSELTLMENKNRFSTLRVFKLPGSSKPPQPPPKDQFHITPFNPYLSAGASVSQTTLGESAEFSYSQPGSNTLRSSESEQPRFLQTHSPETLARSASPSRSPPSASSFKKGLTKFSPFAKRNKTLGAPLPSPSLTPLPEQYGGDTGISKPWGFQHHLHVNGDLNGIPSEWSAALVENGITEDQIAELRVRQRQRAAEAQYDGDGYLTDHYHYQEQQDMYRHSPPLNAVSGREPPLWHIPEHETGPSTISPPPLVFRPKPRTDSLRRPMVRSNTASAALAMVSTARPASPASSQTSSQPRNVSPSYPLAAPLIQSPSNSSHSRTDTQIPSELSVTNSGTQSTSSPSHPVTPFDSVGLRVVNADFTLTPSSPPPAYVSPPSDYNGGMHRRGSTEKIGLYTTNIVSEPGPSYTPHTPNPPEVFAPPSEPHLDDIKVEEIQHHEESTTLTAAPVSNLETRSESAEDDELLADEEEESRDAAPSPLPRAATLPPRLSLHTDDDDWSDMFSFLPGSSGDGKRSSKRMSLSVRPLQSISENLTSKIELAPRPQPAPTENPRRPSIQGVRRSKRFSSAFAIIPPANVGHAHITITTSPSSDVSSVASAIASSPAHTTHTTSSASSSSVYPPSPPTQYPVNNTTPPIVPNRSGSLRVAPSRLLPAVPTVTTSPQADESKDNDNNHGSLVSEFDIRTPDPEYPIANSPLWEEVRMLVRQVGRSPRANEGDNVKSAGQTDPIVQETKDEVPPSPVPSSSSKERTRPPSLNVPPSRFSDATSYHEASRFSDGSALLEMMPQPPSRFSDATSFQSHPRLSEISGISPEDPKSRFSGWSTASSAHGLGTHTFSPMETMPESPAMPSPRRSSFLPPRRSADLPPPLPPPTNGLPPIPAVAEPPRKAQPGSQDESSYLLLSPPADRTSFASSDGGDEEEEEAVIVTNASKVSVPAVQPRVATPPNIPLTGQKKTPTPSRRPPPLPLSPVDNVRQANEARPAKPVIVAYDSPSTSSSGDSGIELAASFSTPEGYDPRSLSATVEDAPKSARLPYLIDTPSPSQIVYTHLTPADVGDDVPPPTPEKDWPPSKRSPSLHDDDPHREAPPWLQQETLPASHNSPRTPHTPHHQGPLLTPSITVNGFDIAQDDSTSDTEPDLPEALSSLKEYIYLDFEPMETFVDLHEVAQGQYGSVYAAHVNSDILGDRDSLVAVKKVYIPPEGTPKIAQLQHELNLMSRVRHKHILGSDGLFFDFVENTLWIRMELMQRSLADILVLSEQDLLLEEPVIARLASDALLALAYISELGIAHRDVRSDNLLINDNGVLKLADFSNAVRVSRQDPTCQDIVGVHHWQAPEMRRGRYNASKVDVWSLGATVWECAESVPPFSAVSDPQLLADRWPPLSEQDEFSSEFHDFLRLSSEPSSSRPSATQLLQHAFILRACPRGDIVELLRICHTIEEQLQE